MTTAILPAAGTGSRLGRHEPKALVRIGAQTFLECALSKLTDCVDRVVIVVSEGAEPQFSAELERIGWTRPTEIVTQHEPTGSADAVALGLGPVPAEEPCLVMWADQVGLSKETIRRVVDILHQGPRQLILPRVEVTRPYVWLRISPDGNVTVGRQRDNDAPPPVGFSDVGLFGFIAATGRECIKAAFPSDSVSCRERDFIYVIPSFAQLVGVLPISAARAETLAVNTPEEFDLAVRAVGAGRS